MASMEQLRILEEVQRSDNLVLLDVLGPLIDNNLLQTAPSSAGQQRYRMLETVREYATGQLDALGETSVLDESAHQFARSTALAMSGRLESSAQ